MRHGFSIRPERGMGSSQIYLEVAAGVTVFILAGRYFEARAKRRSGAALKALLELGAKDVAVLRDGTEIRIPVEQLVVGDRFVVRPGEKIATDGVVEEGTSAIDASLLTGEAGAGRGRTWRPGHRRDRERRRPPRRARHPRRRRHGARPDRPDGRGRPDRQGRRATPRRSDLGDLRPGRDRARRSRRSGSG